MHFWQALTMNENVWSRNWLAGNSLANRLVFVQRADHHPTQPDASFRHRWVESSSLSRIGSDAESSRTQHDLNTAGSPRAPNCSKLFGCHSVRKFTFISRVLHGRQRRCVPRKALCPPKGPALHYPPKPIVNPEVFAVELQSDVRRVEIESQLTGNKWKMPL